MLGKLKSSHRKQRGLTLIEVIVVVAILGILAAILLPSVSGLIGEGDNAAYNADVESVNLSVSEFRLHRHQGPDGGEWGAATGGKRRLYPTVDGAVGDVEIDLATDTPDEGNFPLVKYVDGSGVGPVADAADVTASLLWMGLIVNEPNDLTTSAEQQTTGDAAPQDDEDGEYIPRFAESAHPDNTALDPSGAATEGSYWYVVLHNGTVVAVYLNDGVYYAGFNGLYP